MYRKQKKRSIDPSGVACVYFFIFINPNFLNNGQYLFKNLHQVVFAVKNRDSLILPDWEEELFKYITGTVQNMGQKMLSINGTSNHIHFLIGMKPDCCLSDLVRETKKSSAQMIRQNGLSRFKFSWQEGFGSFSYGHSQLDYIIPYIANQKEHHRKTSFKEEYLSLLNLFGIEYKEEYLFHWIDE